MGYVAKIVYDKDNRVTEENDAHGKIKEMRNRMRKIVACLLHTSPSPRDGLLSRMPSSA